MSKFADALRAIRVYNDHELLVRFGQPRDVMLSYRPPESRACRPAQTHVYSPRFETDPKSAWYDYGQKSFGGNAKDSMPKARAWAAKQYGDQDWVASPFGRYTQVPRRVVEAARKAVKP